MRDCFTATHNFDEGMCVSCKRWYPLKELQAGHFIDGRTNSILFDEEAVHAQCRSCNLFKSGAKAEYMIFMLDKYGEDKVREIVARKYQTVKYKLEDYEAIAVKYRDQVKTWLSGCYCGLNKTCWEHHDCNDGTCTHQE